jgi:hypothetical protein
MIPELTIVTAALAYISLLRHGRNNIINVRSSIREVGSKKWWHWILLGFALLLIIEAVLLWSKWPFTRERLNVSLEEDREQASSRALPHDVLSDSSGCGSTIFPRSSAVGIETEVVLSNPSSTAHASAVFGPWKGAASQLSGSFTLKGADLSKFKALEGLLTGSGKFQGTLKALGVKGQADVAGLRVRRKGPTTAVHAA